MQYLNILGLHFQTVFQHRARSFIWFLIALINPLFMILLWSGAASDDGKIADSWTIANLSTYYLFLIVAGSLLISHIEESVSELDIQEGRLVKYLLKPVSYYWFKFFEEIPHRVLQGFYGCLILVAIFFFYHQTLLPQITLSWFLSTVIIMVLASFISFNFKMLLGFLAFWFTDIWGFYELVQIAMITLAGFIMPLSLYPEWLMTIAYFLPFSYMIYFPLLAIQGQLNSTELIRVIATQIAWLTVLTILYKVMWKQGIKQFTAVGQ